MRISRFYLMLIILFVATSLSCKKKSVVTSPSTPDSSRTQVTFPADNQDIVDIVASISEDSLRCHVETLVGFYTRHTNADTISSERGIGAARRWVYRKFQEISVTSGGRLEVYYENFSATILGAPGLHRNVVARLPGSVTPEVQILVSGHYDSRTLDRRDAAGFAPGANDDGSGTAAVIELARVLSPLEFRSTLLFVAFTGEEEGLYGSRHYAEAAKHRGDRIIAMITNDMIGNIVGGSGNIDSSRVRCFSDDPMESPNRQLARYIELQGEAYVPDFNVDMILARDRPGRGGDHLAFNEQGFTAVRLTDPEDNLNHQHNENDLSEFMSFPYFRKVVQINAAFLASLAWAPPTPTGLSIQEQSSGHFSLRWNGVADDGTDVRYLIALRLINSTTYDSLLDAGESSEFNLSNIDSPMLVSVAARGSDENESLFSLEAIIGQ